MADEITGKEIPKNRRGLITGLILGGVALIAAIVLLVVLVLNGSSGIVGTWNMIENDNGQPSTNGSVLFNSDETFEMKIAQKSYTGSYSFKTNINQGLLYIDKGPVCDINLNNGVLEILGMKFKKGTVNAVVVQNEALLPAGTLEITKIEMSDNRISKVTAKRDTGEEIVFLDNVADWFEAAAETEFISYEFRSDIKTQQTGDVTLLEEGSKIILNLKLNGREKGVALEIGASFTYGLDSGSNVKLIVR